MPEHVRAALGLREESGALALRLLETAAGRASAVGGAEFWIAAWPGHAPQPHQEEAPWRAGGKWVLSHI